MSGDWREINDEKEKYQAYLCSREWAEKREAVRERCGGICERCENLSMDAVHHLTYARKYEESLEDLQSICRFCHEYTHGKLSVDPAHPRNKLLFDYFSRSKQVPITPLPPKLFSDWTWVCYPYRATMLAISELTRVFENIEIYVPVRLEKENLCRLLTSHAAVLRHLNDLLPFEFVTACRWSIASRYDLSEYEAVFKAFGFEDISLDQLLGISK